MKRRVTMPTNDGQMLNMLAKTQESLNTLMAIRFVRNAYEHIDLAYTTRSITDSLIRQDNLLRTNGYMYNELYDIIIALAKVVHKFRTEIVPNAKSLLSSQPRDAAEKLKEQMAAENLSSNVDILCDNIHALYIHTVQLDKDSHFKKPPVYERLPELQELGSFLTTQSIKSDC